MSALVLEGERAVIFDRETGEVIVCSVPTALENVANGKGRFVHGRSGEPVEAVAAEPAVEPAVIPLTEPDVLPLPAAEQAPVAAEPEPVVEPEAPAVVVDDLADVRTTPGDSPEKLEAIENEVDAANAAVKPDALDHDGDGKKGGSKPKRSTDPERASIIAKLRAAQPPIKFFAGAKTEDLKALLPG